MYYAIIVPVSNWAMIHAPALWTWLAERIPGVLLMYAIYAWATMAAMACVTLFGVIGRLAYRIVKAF